MGIPGLKKFISKKCPETLKREQIKTFVDSYRKKNNYRRKVKIAVDGPTCGFKIYGRDTDVYCGGQFNAFKDRIKRFVEAFKNLDISLVFFFLGTIPKNKLKEWMFRKLRSESLYKDFLENVDCDYNEYKRFEWTKQFFYLTIKALYKDDKFVEIYTAPSSKRTNVVSQYARENNCLAILSDDSSYFIYDTIPIFSLKDLNLSEMTTTVVNHKYICEQLQCSQTQLQCMAALTYDQYLNSTLFFKDLEERFKIPLSPHPQVENGETRSYPNFKLLIEYIKTTSGNIAVNNDYLAMKIADEIKKYGDENAQHFTEVFCKFTLSPQKRPSSIYSKARRKDDAPKFANHTSVVQYFTKKVITADISPAVLEAITFGNIMIRTVPIASRGDRGFADYIKLFKPVRIRLYGLIFNSKEINKNDASRICELCPFVTPSFENWPTNDIQSWASAHLGISCSYVEPISTMFNSEQESLTMLWKNKRLKSHENEIIQVNCLLKCFEIATDNSLQEIIPKQFQPLAVILQYMVKYPKISIEKWEVEAFVIQALLSYSENKSWTERRYLEFIHCHLAALFVQGILLYVDISMCCCLDIEPAMPWNYFDGQRFQYCYRILQNGELNAMQLISEKLPNTEVDYYELMKKIVSFIMMSKS